MGAILEDVGGMLLIWLPLILMCLMVCFLWCVVKLTPRVNTQRPASRSSSSVTWNDPELGDRRHRARSADFRLSSQ